MSMEVFKEAKGELYLRTGLQRFIEKGSERYITPLVKELYEHKDLITKIGVGTLLLAGAYTVYKMCCTAGKNPLPDIKPQKMLYLEDRDGNNVNIPMISGTVIDNPMWLYELKDIAVRTKSATNVLIDQIDQLETRDDLITWIIKYQSLEIPGASETTDVVAGTVGCCLVMALRLALVGENLAVTDDAPKRALIDTIKEMRDNNELHLLNGTNKDDFRALQEIETRMHRENIAGYDIIGKALTYLGVQVRTALCFATAKNPSPTNFSTATLGATRMLCGFVNALKSTGKWIADASILHSG